MTTAAQTAQTTQTGDEDHAAIRTQDLRKTYSTNRGNVEAVRGIDLAVAKGP